MIHLFRAELAMQGDGRTVTGYAVPFDVEATVDDGDGPYVEVFKRGAFRHVVRAPNRIKFCYTHTDDLGGWIGKTRALREDATGLFAEFRLDDPRARRDVDIESLAYKIRDNQLGALSVSYIPGHTIETRRGDQLVRERHRVKIVDHIALVAVGAYPMPEPLAVRSAARKSSVESWREWRARLTIDPT